MPAPENNLLQLCQRQKEYFRQGTTQPYAFRRQQLLRLKKIIIQYENQLLDALHADMQKPPVEAFTSEPGFVYAEIDYALKHLRSWMHPEQLPTPLIHFPSRSYILHEPLGQVLIIGPWNYPFQLVISPLIGAIAAGNCALIKPSEMAPQTADLLMRMITEAFPPEYIKVVLGMGEEVIPILMQHRFDHILFTGSFRVGKIIATGAASQLTPVTLELGGKSPCIVDETAALAVSAKRIVWGKFWNAGQTCVAPDYLMVQVKVRDELITLIKKYLLHFYGEDASLSPDYARIITDQRFDTLCNYLQQGKILSGGHFKAKERYLEPTLLEPKDLISPVMREEIFGPILPIITYNSIQEVKDIIDLNPEPLSFYLFTRNKRTARELCQEMTFGGGCINNTLVHLANPNLPFGGVGRSGTGQYHGKSGFDTFSRSKSIMKTSTLIDIPLKYPPYAGKLRWIKGLLK